MKGSNAFVAVTTFVGASGKLSTLAEFADFFNKIDDPLDLVGIRAGALGMELAVFVAKLKDPVEDVLVEVNKLLVRR